MLRITPTADVLDHPKTARLAALLGASVPAAVGHLCGLWGGAAQNTADGDVTDATPDVIAAWARWDGDPDALVSALVRCAVRLGGGGFLDRTHDGRLLVHAWDEHEGRELAARAGALRRAYASRERNRAEPAAAPARQRPRAEQRPQDARHERARSTQAQLVPVDRLGDVAGEEPAVRGANGGKHNKGKEFLDILLAAGVRAALRDRDFKALKDTPLTAAEVAEVFLAIRDGAFGDRWQRDRLSVSSAIDAWNGYQAQCHQQASGAQPTAGGGATERGRVSPAMAAATWRAPTLPPALDRRVS